MILCPVRHRRALSWPNSLISHVRKLQPKLVQVPHSEPEPGDPDFRPIALSDTPNCHLACVSQTKPFKDGLCHYEGGQRGEQGEGERRTKALADSELGEQYLQEVTADGGGYQHGDDDSAKEDDVRALGAASALRRPGRSHRKSSWGRPLSRWPSRCHLNTGG